MAYVPVPKDLSKVKTKVAFNLTKRQIVCFAVALLLGLPLFFLLKDSTGTSLASMAMIAVMLPCFLFAIDKAIEYVRTPEATHTANQWEATDYGKHISNRVYQMRYHISENTRYDREKEKSIPYSWTLSWSIYTNSPHNYGQAKIAGQERKNWKLGG